MNIVKIMGAIGVIGMMSACGMNTGKTGDAPHEMSAGQAADGAPMTVVTTGKNVINDTAYFTFEFTSKPALGVVVARVRLFDANDTPITEGFTITGDSGMPSMRHHDSGDIPFKLNKKGDYLLPVNVVMPGTWRVKVTVAKEQTTLYAGEITFEVK